MIDKRKPHYRRQGEKDGRRDWGKYLSWFIEIVLLCCILYVSFMWGRHFESVTQKEKEVVDQTKIYKEYPSYRVRGK